MKLKGNFIYENTEELKKAIQEKSIKVEDELITEDIDGEAAYVVANITDKEIALVRKFVLRDPRPRRYKYDLIDWLNHEYKDTLDETLKAMMIAPEGQQLIDLPREVEVFGENEYGVPEEGSRWEYFKKLNNRICGISENAEWSEWWWMNTQARASAAYFCYCVKSRLCETKLLTVSASLCSIASIAFSILLSPSSPAIILNFTTSPNPLL